MSYTLVIILLIGIPLFIYILVSINRKKKNIEKGEDKKGSEYQEGKAKDTKFR
jgi:ABC-type spermidine/putrescine transport system permease subunit II